MDLILSRKLSELIPDGETLDELVIRIPSCGHIFTVETLDGVTDISSYYERDGNGQWKSLAQGPVDFIHSPMCPSCRSPIRNARYGRIYKRAELDLLERNAASRGSRQLSEAQSAFATLPPLPSEPPQFTAGVNSSKDAWMNRQELQNIKKQRDKALSLKKDQLPLATNQWLHPGKVISAAETKKWKEWCHWSQICTIYERARKITAIRSPHTRAWEAERSGYYRATLKALTENPGDKRQNPEAIAMRLTRIQFNGPPPRADKRYMVEAIWLTLDLRFVLAAAAEKWLVGQRQVDDHHYLDWAAWIRFLLQSCIRDSKIAWQTAEDSFARRQAARSLYLQLKSQFEMSRFNAVVTRRKPISDSDRQELAGRISKQLEEQDSAVKLAVRKQLTMVTITQEDVDWLRDYFETPCSKLMSEWENLIKSIRMDVFYSPVSATDYREVVKAFRSEFSEFIIIFIRNSTSLTTHCAQ